MLVLALIAGICRWYVLPRLDVYRQQLVHEMSRAAGRQVRVAELRGEWRGAHIHLTMRGFELLDRHGAPALRVDLASGELSWWSLLRVDLLFRDLQIKGMLVRLGRDSNGRLWLGDLPLYGSGKRTQVADWVLRQDQLGLTHADFLWQDAAYPSHRLHLTDIAARYEGGFFVNEAELSFRPAGGGRMPWRLSSSWRGDSLERFSRWRGSMSVALPATRLEDVLPWILPSAATTSGFVTGNLNLDFAAGKIHKAHGAWSGRDLRFKYGAMQNVMQINSLSAHFTAQAWKDSGYAAQADKLRLHLSGQPRELVLDGIRFARQGAEAGSELGEVQFSQLDLQSLGPVLAEMVPVDTIDIGALAPTGRLRDVNYQWQGPWRSPSRYQANLTLDNGSWSALGAMPGVAALDARFHLDEKGGSVKFAPTRGALLTLDLPRTFDQALSWSRFDGQLHWRHERHGVHFALDKLAMANADVSGVLKGTYAWQPGSLGTVQLEGDFGPVKARTIGPYLPKILNIPTISWLRQAFTAGTVPQTSLTLRGALADFPFENNSKGLFRISSKLQGVQLNYGESWPTVDAIDGHMLFEGRRMQIDARSARILDARVLGARASIRLLDVPEPHLIVEGKVEGATRSFLDFINQSPLQARVGGIAKALDVLGNGQLDLTLDLPLNTLDASQVRGRYQFADQTLLARGMIPRVEAVTGILEFTEKGVNLQQARGRTLGGQLVLDAHTRQDGVTEVDIKGHADARTAVQFYQLPLSERLSGSADYSLHLADETEGLSLQLRSTLEGVGVKLPAPLGKSIAHNAGLNVQMRTSAKGREQWGISYQQTLGVSLVYLPSDKGSVLERGQITVGSGQIPVASRAGLWLDGHLPLLRVDDWQGLLGGVGGTAGGLDGMSLVIDALEWQGRRWPAIDLSLQRDARRWNGKVQSPLVQGSFSADLSGRGVIKAQLQKLSWPALLSKGTLPRSLATETAQVTSNPADWPELELTVEHMLYNGRDVGQLSLGGRPLANGYRVTRLHLLNADADIKAGASWLREGALWRGQLDVNLDGENLGGWLTRWGQKDLLRQGSGRISADLTWLQAGLMPRMAEINGDVHADLGKGTLLKVNPGVGRLLGLMNIESLLRRVRLDFRDVLSQGLAFNTLTSVARLQGGMLNVDSLMLAGPAVDVALHGKANLQSEALNLSVRVEPSLSGGVAVAGAIVNPLVGLSLLVLQQVFSNPVGKMLSYTYNVGGTWSKPVVRSSDVVPVVDVPVVDVPVADVPVADVS